MFRAELRRLGFPDEYFETFIWPLVTDAHRTEQLEQDKKQLEQDKEQLEQELRKMRERERAQH